MPSHRAARRVSCLRLVRTIAVKCTYTIKKLTKTGNSLALVLDKPLLQQLGIDEETELEISTNGDALVVSPVRRSAHERKVRKAAETINERYAGLFERLSK